MRESSEVQTPQEFLRLLEASQLLDAAQLRVATGMLPDCSSAKMLARRLAAKGTLTRWQAGQLLTGWSRLRLGNYKLCRQIETGQFGRVFLAEHVGLQREVAIKTLSRRFARRQAIVERFLQDAREAAALDHRNLVHVLDVDSADDQYFMVMDYVDGQDLQRLVTQHGSLPPPRVADFLLQAAEGLAYALDAGMLHHSIQPANLMVDQKGIVKVLGLAVRHLASADAAQSASPAAHPLADCGDYRAPEQRFGNSHGDARSDVFSLGCTAAFLITGHAPQIVQAPTKLDSPASSPHNDPAVDVRFAWEQVAGELPLELIEIIETMAAGPPEQRYQSVKFVCEPLRDWLATNRQQEASPLPQSLPQFSAPAVDATESPVSVVTVDAAPPREKGSSIRAEGSTVDVDRWWRPSWTAALFAGILVAAGVAYLFWPEPIDSRTAARSKQAPLPSTGTVNGGPPSKLRSHREARADATTLPVVGAGQQEDEMDPSTAQPPGTDFASAEQADPDRQGDAKNATSKGDTSGTPTTTDVPRAGKVAVEQPGKKTVPPKKEVPGKTGGSTKETKNPFLQFPAAVDLPDIRRSDEDASELVMNIGPVLNDALKGLTLSLLGGQHVSNRDVAFVVNVDPNGDALDWGVSLQEQGPSDPSLPVARFRFIKGQLQFNWEPTATQHVLAQNLANCVLRLEFKSHVSDVRLRRVREIEPMMVDLTRQVIVVKSPLPFAPDDRQVRFEITQLEAPFPNVYNLNPVKPVPIDGTPVIAKIGHADLEGHVLLLTLKPELRSGFRLECSVAFLVSPKLEPIPMIRQNFETTASWLAQKLNAENLNAQRVRNSMAALRKNDPQRKTLDEKRKRLEAEVARTAAAVERIQALQALRESMIDGAPLHFRLYCLADGVEVDLIRSANEP